MAALDGYGTWRDWDFGLARHNIHCALRLLLFILAYYILGNLWPRSRPWHWGVIGASLFALSVPIWIAAFGGHFFRDDLIFLVFGAIAGGVSFYELRRRTLLITNAA